MNHRPRVSQERQVVLDEEWVVVPPGTATEQQVLAYCELMNIDPSAETMALLRTKSPVDLMVRAGRQRDPESPPLAQPSVAARQRFEKAFGSR
ncbi:MAG TPA: hypothetical protein VIU87_07130 [Mycobacterium sp.]